MDGNWRMALMATRHCLTGCAAGEIVGMVLTTWWGWGNLANIVVSVVLAFVFGWGLTFTAVRRAGLDTPSAARTALASDTVSILSMETVDNLGLLVWPGVMDAGLSDWLFWVSLVVTLGIAFVVTVPVNHALIKRGRGHAVMHDLHGGHDPAEHGPSSHTAPEH